MHTLNSYYGDSFPVVFKEDKQKKEKKDKKNDRLKEREGTKPISEPWKGFCCVDVVEKPSHHLGMMKTVKRSCHL